ncbi:minor capsid protein, partial [Enterococcus raffinosus]
KYEAERLMRTESARVQTEIQNQSYKKYGIEEYEYIAEPTACLVCLPLNGKIFKVEDLSPGQNAGPMHANCRCSTAPYVDRAES